MDDSDDVQVAIVSTTVDSQGDECVRDQLNIKAKKTILVVADCIVSFCGLVAPALVKMVANSPSFPEKRERALWVQMQQNISRGGDSPEKCEVESSVEKSDICISATVRLGGIFVVVVTSL